MPLPKKINLSILQKILDLTFLETGTSRGGGLDFALKNNFKKIISIEPVKEYYDYCTVKYKEFIDKNLIVLHNNASENIFAKILTENNLTNFFYWLDAHAHGEIINENVSRCPISYEVDAIIKRNNPNDVIFIDDLRILNGNTWREKSVDWKIIKKKLKNAFPNSALIYLDGHIPHDVLVIINKNYLKYVYFDQ